VNMYAKIVSGAFTRFVVKFRGFYSRISYSATVLKVPTPEDKQKPTVSMR
jgi:hypothetical protein